MPGEVGFLLASGRDVPAGFESALVSGAGSGSTVWLGEDGAGSGSDTAGGVSSGVAEGEGVLLEQLDSRLTASAPARIAGKKGNLIQKTPFLLVQVLTHQKSKGSHEIKFHNMQQDAVIKAIK